MGYFGLFAVFDPELERYIFFKLHSFTMSRHRDVRSLDIQGESNWTTLTITQLNPGISRT